MKVIIGGAYQGKLAYAKKTYGITDDVTLDFSYPDDWRLHCDEILKAAADLHRARCVHHTERYLYACVREGIAPVAAVSFAQDAILIFEDIFCGIVPMDAIERRWREEAGRYLTALCEAADRVERVYCGIPQAIRPKASVPAIAQPAVTKKGAIMIQSTMSDVGKTLLVTGLCRVFAQDGYRVCPFKAQNMTTHTWQTDAGEMNVAQILQAEAAGLTPNVRMNPVLLKPRSDTGSEVFVLGQHVKTMEGEAYFAYKEQVRETILTAYQELASQYDIMVIEGAGSAAELNLRAHDVVNMGFAKAVDAPVVLAGNIDPGGIFAQLFGTMALLREDEQARVQGLIVNKFRGDRALFASGVRMLEETCARPVLGVIPYMDITLEAEDSLSDPSSYVPAKDMSAQDRLAQYDHIAAVLRSHLDMEAVYRIVRGETCGS